MNIKAVLMDIGGVILINTANEDDFARMANLFSGVIGVDATLLNDVRKEYLQESLTGKFSNADYFKEIEFRASRKLPGNIEELWVKAITPEIIINEALLRWVDETRAHCKVVVFSTISSLRFSIDEALGIYSHFDEKFLSTEVGMTKSNAAFFTDALTSLNIKPEEALLIDDQISNIERANKLGINGLWFKSDFYTNPNLFLGEVSKYEL